jgi:hypothetical protein
VTIRQGNGGAHLDAGSVGLQGDVKVMVDL